MMTLTREDVEKLSAPLPLEAGHEVRVAETFSQNTKARWLVYTTEDPVRDRLTEVDPGWQLRNAQIVISGDSATVSQEMVVCDAARTGVGGASVKREEDTLDHDVIKAAATDSIKRAARLFGVGAYLLDAPRIVTDWKPGKLDWRERQEYEKQAFAQFARWYKQRFGNDTRAIDGDTGEVTRSEAQPTTRAQRSTQETGAPHGDELPPAAQEMAQELPLGTPRPEDVWVLSKTLYTKTAATMPKGVNWGFQVYEGAKKLGYADEEAVRAVVGVKSLNDWDKTLGELLNTLIDNAPTLAEAA
jgi:hypothetical protein